MENPLETGREAIEETGIDIFHYLPQQRHLDERAIAISLPQYFLEELIDAQGDQQSHTHLDFIYVVTIPYQEPLLEATEHHAIRWFYKKELERESVPLFDNIRMILSEIL